MEKKNLRNRKAILVLTLAITALMIGSVFLTSAYAATPPFSATFTETGLPTGATYQVSLTNSSHTATASANAGSNDVLTGLYNGTYVLSASATVGTGHTYSELVWNAPTSTLVGISGAYTGSVSFSEEFLLNFTETGLAKGTAWSIDFNNIVTSTNKSYQNFNEKNGSYAYTMMSVTGYTASPISGTMTVSGANQTTAIKYTQTSTAQHYNVNFVESYLPSGTGWQVNIIGSTSQTSNTNTIIFSLVNGTYSYTINNAGHWYAATFSGSFTVNGNSNLPAWEKTNGLQLNVTFRYGYLVTFSASGLASYVPWSVTFNGSLNSTTGTSSSITFEIRNGTNYTYSVSIAPNWKVSPASGKFNVSGAAVTESLTFTKLFFRLIFIESTLPASTAWIMTVNNVPYPTTNGTVILSEHNGTYNYTAMSESGYTVKPASGTITLQYSDVVTTIVYTPTKVNSTTGSGGSGFPLPTEQSIISFFHTDVGYVAAGLIVVLLVVGVYEIGIKHGHKKKGKNYK